MRNVWHSLARLLLLVVVTGALMATGFGHRLSLAGNAAAEDAALQAYVLAGGDLSDLCAGTDSDGTAAHGDCPACHIAATADLPPADFGLNDAELHIVAAIAAPCEWRLPRPVLDPARGMRAPPLA